MIRARRPNWRFAVAAAVALVLAVVTGVLLAKVASLERQSARLESEVARLRAADGDLRADVREARTAAAARKREIGRLEEQVRVRQTCRGRGSIYDGPQVVVVPDRGPPGTRITIVGDCFKGRRWNAGYGIFLIRGFAGPRACEIIASARPFALRVAPDGRARGFFTVPSTGDCFQEGYGRRVTAGVYLLGIGCHACGTARFRVTDS